MQQPLILVTNDDGIESAGLWAAAEALLPLGEVLVVAPDRQWSGGGRSMPPHVTGRIRPATRWIHGQRVAAYAVDASPALAVQHAVLELAMRPPSLAVSGINFGLNLGTEVTISGTVGAALEASAFDIPALAVSLEMDPAYHLTGDVSADYSTAMAYIQRFAWHQLVHMPSHDVDVLNINVPSGATTLTPWRLTRLSRQRFFAPTAPDRTDGQGRPGYVPISDLGRIEVDSDIWAVHVDRAISVTPLSLDLTSRIDLTAAHAGLCAELAAHQDVTELLLAPYPGAPQEEGTYETYAMETPALG
jgi:5'-nucleotidase